MALSGKQMRARKERILETSAQNRRVWDPDPESYSWRRYKRWADATGQRPTVENFCHYWRVVLIWEPLRRMREPFKNRSVQITLLIFVALITVGALTLVAMIWTEPFLSIALSVLGTAYVFGSIGVCLHYADMRFDDGPGFDWMRDRSRFMRGLMVALAIPVAIPLSMLGFGGYCLYYLFEKRRIHIWFIEPLSRRNTWLRPITLAAAIGLTYLAISAWWFTSSRIVLLVLLGLVIAAAFAVLLAYLSDRAEQKRQRERKERLKQREAEFARHYELKAKALTRILFLHLHPEHAENEEAYTTWLNEFAESFGHTPDTLFSREGYFVIEGYLWINYAELVSTDLMDDDESIPLPKKPKRRPLRVISEVFALAWSVLVVTKRKGCPLVKFPDQDVAS